MNQETSTQTRVLNSAFGRPPKGERRVRFADTMGMELVSIFLFELINEYFHNHDSRTRRHQLKLMGHSHNQQQGQLNINGTSNNQLKLTSNSDSQYYNNSNNNSSSYNTYNKSAATNTSTTIYQTHNSSSGYNYSSGYHSSSYNNSNNNYDYNNYTQCSPRNTSTSNTAATAAAANNNNGNHNAAASQTSSEPTYICEFTQPISLLSFKERVKLNKVHLETCQVNSTAGHVSVSCTVRVLNLSYDKSVIVRYTTDDWRTHTDSLTSYKPGSSDGWSDKFTSTFTVTNQVQSFQAGQRIIFAIRCLFDGSDAHWDNNGGLNYAIRRQR